MEDLRLIKQLDLSGKRVLFTFDLETTNGNGNSEGTDSSRLKKILPSIRSIIASGGMPILLCHYGAPNGRRDPKLSLAPLAKLLSHSLNLDVIFASDPASADTESLCKEAIPGRVVLVENIGFNPEEDQNDPSFANRLSRLGDVFISDAFESLSTRRSSTVSLPSRFREKAAGMLLASEIEFADKCFQKPRRPLVFILGGHTLGDNIELLECAAAEADKIIIGGAVANTFLSAQGLQVGRSVFERDYTAKIFDIVATVARRDCRLYFPVDFMVGPSPSAVGLARAVPSLEIPADTMTLDIGPASIALFQEVLGNAETIVWHGTMGASENEEFSRGTSSLIEAISSAHGTKIVFGNSTQKAITEMELGHKFDHISSGAKAFHSLLLGRPLPGLSALRN